MLSWKPSSVYMLKETAPIAKKLFLLQRNCSYCKETVPIAKQISIYCSCWEMGFATPHFVPNLILSPCRKLPWTQTWRSPPLRIQSYQMLLPWGPVEVRIFSCFTCCQEFGHHLPSQFIQLHFFSNSFPNYLKQGPACLCRINKQGS